MARSSLSLLVPALAVAFALAGCAAGSAIPRSPAQGGNPWLEVKSKHFRVVSDLDPADARRIAIELEQGVAAIEYVAFQHSRAALEPTTVVVFREERDFHAFAPTLADGTFRRQLFGDLEPAQFMVLHGELTPDSRVSCLHELTHDLFERNFGAAPPWLHEGWAQYYSTVAIGQGHVRVGGALPHLTFTPEPYAFVGRAEDGSGVLAVPIDDVVKPSELLKLDRKGFYRAVNDEDPSDDARKRTRALYLGSWAFVHLLNDRDNVFHPQYVRFLDLVREERVPVAWDKAFVGVSDADLDGELVRYLKSGALEIHDSTVELPGVATLESRPLRDEEVRLLWGRLVSEPGEGARLADQQFDAALRGAPDWAEAHYFRGLSALKQKRLSEAEPHLLRASALAPTDPRYLLALLILRLQQEPDQDHNVRAGNAVMKAAEALVRVANSPMQFRILALTYRELPDLENAHAFAQRAVALNPIGSLELDAEATVLNDLGRPGEALRVERAALAFLPENWRNETLQAHLRLYEQRVKSEPK